MLKQLNKRQFLVFSNQGELMRLSYLQIMNVTVGLTMWERWNLTESRIGLFLS